MGEESNSIELTCICCPLGCPLRVQRIEEDWMVTGNTCPRGETYGKKELTNPTRTITSSIRVLGGTLPMVSVKTKEEIPKDKIADVMRAIHETKAVAPIEIGQVLIEDCEQTGVDIVATKKVAIR